MSPWSADQWPGRVPHALPGHLPARRGARAGFFRGRLGRDRAGPGGPPRRPGGVPGQPRRLAVRAARPQLQGRLRADQRPALRGVARGEQPVQRDSGEPRVAVPGLPVGERQLGALDDRVQVVRAARRQAAQAEPVQQCQLLQEHRALPPRAGLAHGQAHEVEAGRLFHAGLPAGQVGPAEQRPVRLAGQVHHLGPGQVAVDGLGHEALVVGPAGGVDLLVPVRPGRLGLVQDPLVRRGQRRVGEPGPGRGHPTAQVHLGRAGPVLAEQLLGRGDGRARPGRHRVAVPRIADRVPHDRAQRQPAVPLQEQQPGPERRGHAGRQQAVPRDQVKTQLIERQYPRTAAGRTLAVQHENLAVAGAADDGHLAAQPVHVRLDHLEYQARRDRGVERGAVGLQHGHARGRGQPVRRGHHAERARELWPGSKRGTLREHWRSWGGGIVQAGRNQRAGVCVVRVKTTTRYELVPYPYRGVTRP